jgi:hypothetical protein
VLAPIRAGQQLDRHRRELGARLPHMKLLAERNFDMLKVGGCNLHGGW